MLPRAAPLLGALALVLAGPASAFVEYNTTMRSTAAILSYAPFNTTADAGWNETYATSWGVYNPGAMPDGDGAHVSSHAGATVSVSWVGTGAYFHGSGGDVTVAIDGEERFAGGLGEGDVVGAAGVGGLAYAHHTAVLSVTGGTVRVTNVTLTTIIGGDGAVDVDEIVGSLADMDPNPALEVLGRWKPAYTICGEMMNATWSSSSCAAYDTLVSSQPGASVAMQVPANASVAIVAGPVGSGYGDYTVVVDPVPPLAPANYSGNARRAWISPGNMLYYGSLDPAQRYTLRIVARSGNVQWSAARFIITQGGAPWSPPAGNGTGNGGTVGGGGGEEGEKGNATTSKFPVGAVVGGIVGGLLLLLLAAGLVWWRRRKGTGPRKRRPVSKFEVDIVDQTNQSGALGTYHAMTDPVQANADMIPDTSESRITPLPVPWPGDVVSLSSGKSALSHSTGRYASLSADQHPSQSHGTQSHGQAFGVGGVYNSSAPSLQSSPVPHSAQSLAHDYPPKSPFTDSAAPSPPTPSAPAQTYPPSLAAALKKGPGPSLPPQPRPQPQPAIVTQAEDGGRVVEEVVPPRYDPAWRDEGGRT
ncbi:hypothetical protein CspeluHIS016_0501480 [Cutaneotrichosporon spelunceum]|uniref:Fibronectin type-III domain-containing protein n=1 Tax=Cutaneotrichosporon spelunceum TaxID=1672016 RepID=A0AAD3YCI9_9TREE|nr:hypothetical protein CspeluHIS016_0501480 [Cutaneotrichosporon spelunceum]